MKGAVFCWAWEGWPPPFWGRWLVFAPITPALRTHDSQMLAAGKDPPEEA